MRTATRDRFVKTIKVNVATAPQFAHLLNISVSTLKRLLNKGILPSVALSQRLEKRGQTPWRVSYTQHWRISYTQEDLRLYRAAIAIWKVWRRKPRASRDRERLSEIDSLLDALIFSADQADDGWAYNFWNLRRHDAEKWRNRLLEAPDIGVAASFILWLSVLKFRASHKDQRPSRRDLSEMLGISERSLYLLPFGKAALALAFRERALTSEVKEEASPTGGMGAEDFFHDREPEELRDDSQPQKSLRIVNEPPMGSGDDARGRSLKRKVRQLPKVEGEEVKETKTGREKTAFWMLVIYPLGKWHEKQRWDELRRSSGRARPNRKKGEKPIKSNKTFAKLAEQKSADPSFAGWSAGRCFRAGRSWLWELNFSPFEKGVATSLQQARGEIENRVSRQLETARQRKRGKSGSER